MTYLKNNSFKFEHWQHIAFKDAWDKQTEFFEQIIAQKLANRNAINAGSTPVLTPNYLFFCYHPHVYTLGKSGKEAHLLIDQQMRDQKKIEFFHINRGGDITYHGPGQIVGYPVLDMENFFTDLHKFMRYLEETIILTIAHWGLEGKRIEGLTGVWLNDAKGPRKICAMGIKTSRWVSMHGFALNVNTDLSFFDHIVPCGITDKAVTSMAKELGCQVSLLEVEKLLVENFAKVFQADLIA